MTRLIALTTLGLALPAAAAAHVGVRPRESKAGAEEHYTVRVPTEGAAATTSVRFEIPEGVTVLDVPKPAEGTVNVKRAGGRIVEIVWTREIKPKESAEFTFRARNPSEGASLIWKAHQMFADGTSADWTDAPGAGRRTAAITKLLPAQAAAVAADEAARIATWLDGYDAAFIAKDLERLGSFYHPDVTIYEGGGVNNGWADYRDHHLGPELKAFENLQFGHTGRQVHILGDGRSAYVVSQYFIKARMGERTIDSGGLETLVLVKGADGAWKIRHSHTSSRPRRPAGGGD